jgi:hypothetical protein
LTKSEEIVKKKNSKPCRKRGTTVERTEYRRGAFLHGIVKGAGDDREGFTKMLEANSERGRIAKWKPHAERLGVGLDDLAEAESLIDDRGRVADIDRFDLHLTRARADIDLEQVEKTFVPLAVYGQEAKRDRSRGGADSHGLNAPDRRRRNVWIVSEVARLRAKGLSQKRACDIVSKTLPEEFRTEEDKPLHPDTIKKIVKKLGHR